MDASLQTGLMLLALAAAALLQGTLGFAYALIAVPMLVLAGVGLAQAMATVVTASLAYCVLGARQLGPDTPWRAALGAGAMRWMGIGAGTAVLAGAFAWPPGAAEALVGVVLVGTLAASLLRVGRLSRWRAGRVAGAGAFAACGLLSGLCGMGGAPSAAWTSAQAWPPRRSSGFLFALFMLSTPFQLLLLRLLFGSDAVRGMRVGMWSLPIVLLASMAGAWLDRRLSPGRMRHGTYAVLAVLACGLLAHAALSLAR